MKPSDIVSKVLVPWKFQYIILDIISPLESFLAPHRSTSRLLWKY